ncbi:turripeptide Ici9.2-like [Rhodnius prolixus]|uniref:Putative kazalzinho kazal type serine protease inhibitor n=1 Tax=Rhodnius prolixus TaxID=13249 RepID=R4FJ94_RHOPR
MKLYSLAVLVSVFFTYSSGDKESDLKECKTLACPMHWLPVCGVKENKFRTFGNKCDFERTNCFSNPMYTFVNKGRCEERQKKNKGRF